MALKKTKDGKLPSTLTALSSCYDAWKDRVMRGIMEEQTPMEESQTTSHETDGLSDNNIPSQISLVLREDEISAREEESDGMVVQDRLEAMKSNEDVGEVEQSQSVDYGDSQTTVQIGRAHV